MTQIPSGTKFVGISSTVPTPENRSAQNNSTTEIYTLADLQESVLDLTTPPNDGDVLTYDTGTNAPVWTAPTGSSSTTCIVNIPSAASGTITYSDGRPNATGGILGIGSSPIELLPAPGVGKYYDIEKIIIEYTYVTTNYTSANLVIQATFGNIYALLMPFDTQNTIAIINSQWENLEITEQYPIYYQTPLNQGLNMTTMDNSNPTLGNGTLRVIITYTTRTFGA